MDSYTTATAIGKCWGPILTAAAAVAVVAAAVVPAFEELFAFPSASPSRPVACPAAVAVLQSATAAVAVASVAVAVAVTVG